VKLVSGDREGGHLAVADFDADRVGAGVEGGGDGQAGGGGGRADELEDGFVAGQGSASPVEGDLGEQPVFDLG
jgi:hypothetical protein